jgi:hypothetical protein
MISIAFLALILTVFVQMILLQRSVAREQLLRALAERERAVAEAEALRARAQLELSRQQAEAR